MIKYCITYLCLFSLLMSCATKEKIEYVDRDVNHYIVKVEKDTLINNTHDSIFVEIQALGDTIYKTEYKEKRIYVDKIKWRHDTLIKDSIQVQYKEVAVEKKTSRLDKIFFSLLGLICIFAILMQFGKNGKVRI